MAPNTAGAQVQEGQRVVIRRGVGPGDVETVTVTKIHKNPTNFTAKTDTGMTVIATVAALVDRP